MTPSGKKAAADDDQRGVLGDTGGLDTAGLGFLPAHTEQVRVVMPAQEDDDLLDDEIVADEIGTGDLVVGDLVTDDPEPETVEAELVETGPVEAFRTSTTSGAEGRGDADADEVDALDALVEDAPGVPDDTTDVLPGRVLADEPEAAAVSDVAAGSPVDSAPVTADTARVTGAAPVPDAVPAPDPTPVAATATSGPVTGPHDTRWARSHPDDPNHEDRVHAVERVHPPREVSLTSRRLDDFEPHRESADLLTADRLLDRQRGPRAEPEGAWQQFVYAVSRGRINLGDGRRARARKDLDRRIAAPLPGGAKFVPVMSRKGGVGKTTVTTLLGMALADARDDRIIAVDANPDRGTLADRFARSSGRTVRDLARRRGQITDFHELSSIVARDDTRLDVLASDNDPRMSEAFSDRDYHDVASIAAHYYSIVVTDTGTGVVHSVMGATLDLADQIVVVAGLSVDEARLASEMLTWLETNGYAHQVREAVVVLNNSRPGSPLVRRGELEAHFRTRVRAVVDLPYDPLIAAGSAISFRDLQPATRAAARAIAAEVVGGLKQSASAA